MERYGRRRVLVFQPQSEAMEDRLLLSTVPFVNKLHPFHKPLSYPAETRPNTPVLPFQTASKNATYVDPSAHIDHGQHVAIAYKSYIGAYASLIANTGFIKIGNGSTIDANATINSNPTGARNPTTSVIIGDSVSIGPGASVLGPSTIGAIGAASKPTTIGPNALIDGATIEPGALVGALARVGPGVTVPSGYRVLPGSNVTTDAQASDPSLGMVVPVTASDMATASETVLNHQALAAGYLNLYQGNAATGAWGAAGIATGTAGGVNNGDLATIEGAGAEPGSATVPFEPTSGSPTFLAPMGQQQQGLLYNFTARVTGGVNFHQTASQVERSLGRGDAILGDQGQPITFGSITSIGNNVTITSPVGNGLSTAAPVTFDENFTAGNNAVILGAQGVKVNIGDNVSIGSGAVVSGSSIGPNSTIGSRAYVANSSLPAGSNVSPGEVIIDNKVVGSVAW